MNRTNHLSIALISDAIYPYNKGGKETRIHELSTRMAANGWDVHIYTMKWWKGPDVITESGRTLHAISPLMPLYTHGRRSISQGIRFGFSCFKLLFANPQENLKSLIFNPKSRIVDPKSNQGRFALIEADSMPYFLLFSLKYVSLFRRIPLVAVWHEVWPKEYWKSYLGATGIFAYWLEKTAAFLPNRIIAVSGQTAEGIRTIYGRKDGITVIENGIDTDAVAKVKPSRTKTDFLFAGRLLSHKNVDLLIRAFAEILKKHPRMTLGIIGEGPELGNLKKLVQSHGIGTKVTFFGFKKDISEVYAHMKSSKVFVLPSEREGFGITVLEANAAGIPAVTIDAPGNAARHLVKERVNGFIAKPDTDSLARTMMKAHKGSHIIQSKCIKIAQQYSWDKVSASLQTYYETQI